MDKIYWESYYKLLNGNLEPSSFAEYVASDVIKKQHRTLIELGCGNGRDAIYFANKNINVLAIDQCEYEVDLLKNSYKQLDNLVFKSGDFSKLKNDNQFDIVYSRFALHSVSKEQEVRTLNWAYDNLNTNGYFCIEVRGQKNEIYQMGEMVTDEKNAFIFDGHYRRFLNFNELCFSLREIGFNIEHASEEKGFAPFRGMNETYIRVISKKI